MSNKAKNLFRDLDYLPFSIILEIEDKNPLKGSSLLFYTRDMPIIYLGNKSTLSSVINRIYSITIYIVPDPKGKYSLLPTLYN